MAVATLCMLCSCTSAHKQAERLVAEYQQKADSVSQELDSTNVSFTPEEWEYVEAYSNMFKYKTAGIVAENWKLTSRDFYQESGKYAEKAGKLEVALSDKQQDYMSKWSELKMYEATVFILKKWQELH